MTTPKNNVGSIERKVNRKSNAKDAAKNIQTFLERHADNFLPTVIDPSGGVGVATYANSNPTTSTTSTSSTNVISETAAMYMRAKTVTFTATGLRPNSIYYPFFNGVYVGNYCSTVNGQRSSTITTNALGDVVGNFYLPGGVFTAGVHTFLLVDNINNVNGITTADELYSSASADYTANGVLKLLQTTVTNETVIIDSPTPVDPVVKECVQWEYQYSFVGVKAQRYWKVTWIGLKGQTPPEPVRPSGVPIDQEWVIRKPWFEVGPVACPVQIGVQTVVRVDPLAQTFFIDASKYPNGVFVTAITLYFRSVDQSAPAIVELRDTVNGYPGPNILPGGQAYRPGRSNSQSADSSVGTTFKFDEPVYLESNLEYCFVVKSSSLGYNLWCSKQGDTDKITGKLITDTKVPGMLFKSSNDSAWTTDQLEDIKFDLWIAQFNTNITSYILFDPLKDTASNNFYNTAQTIPLSYISTTDTSGTVGIKVPMHGLVTGDYVYIDDLPEQDYNGIAYTNLSGAFTATVIDDDNITITAKNSDVATSTSRILAGDALQVLDLVPSVLPSGQTFEAADLVTNINNNSPSTIPETPTPLTRPTAPSKANLTSFTIFTNVMINEVMIDYMGTEFTDVTNIVEKIRIPEGYSTSADDGVETPYNEKPFVEIDNDGTFHEFDEPRLFASPRNETLHAAELNGSTSLRVNIEMASTDPNISPVIDINGMSIIARSHKIDNQNGEIDELIDAGIEANFQDPDYNSEIEAGTGVAASKYKSTVNLLQNPANNLVLFVMGICPSPAVFDAYVRTSNDESTHADKDWTWVDINGEFGTAFNNSPDRKTMVEWRFNYATTEPFTVFDIKLVMRSKNNSIVPKIYSIRALTNRMI